MRTRPNAASADALLLLMLLLMTLLMTLPR
jgi:hypothetical protein